MILRLFAVLVATVLFSCRSPCDDLADRLCACDPSRGRNRRACKVASSDTHRRRAYRVARQSGVDPEAVCRRALEEFRCPVPAK